MCAVDRQRRDLRGERVVLAWRELLGQDDVDPAALSAPGAHDPAVDEDPVGMKRVRGRSQGPPARGDEEAIAVSPEEPEIRLDEQPCSAWRGRLPEASLVGLQYPCGSAVEVHLEQFPGQRAPDLPSIGGGQPGPPGKGLRGSRREPVNMTSAELFARLVDVDIRPRDFAHPQGAGGPPQGDPATRAGGTQTGEPAAELASVQCPAHAVRELVNVSNSIGGEREPADREDAEVLPGQDVHGLARTVGLDQGWVLPGNWFAARDSSV
jgi:hypothetical protein